MDAHLPAPFFDGAFPHHWQAEILPARPLILPTRHFVYPREVEEVERGALEVLIRPDLPKQDAGSPADLKGHGFNRAEAETNTEAASAAEEMQVADPTFPPGLKPTAPLAQRAARLKSCPSKAADPFLATCALGFRDPAVPTGLWSTPRPEEICAVSGGYAYIIDTQSPERFTMIAYRPVLELRPVTALGLLLFVGHHSILAWGANGQAWESKRLTSEGLTLAAIDGNILHGLGWDMMTDKEIPFALDLRSGQRVA